MKKSLTSWTTPALAAVVLLAGWGIHTANAQDAKAFDVRIAKPMQFNVRMKQMPNLPHYAWFQQVGNVKDRFWIGVATEPTSETLRSQLGLKGKHGLVVRDVAPDSPGAKAGLKKHDVLVSAGGEALANIQDLVTAVSQSEPVKIKLYRQGKQQTIEVTPAKRPADAIAEFPQMPPEFRKLMDQARQQAGGPMQFRFVGPGMLMQPSKLPKNVSVSISRQGEGPAKITVKRGDETWDVTEKELDKLPEDLRKPVREMLGGVGATPFNFKFQGFDQLPPGVRDQIKNLPRVRVERNGIRVESKSNQSDDVQKQMEELRGQLDELRKALDERNDEREALLKTLRKILDQTKD